MNNWVFYMRGKTFFLLANCSSFILEWGTWVIWLGLLKLHQHNPDHLDSPEVVGVRASAALLSLTLLTRLCLLAEGWKLVPALFFFYFFFLKPLYCGNKEKWAESYRQITFISAITYPLCAGKNRLPLVSAQKFCVFVAVARNIRLNWQAVIGWLYFSGYY